MITTVCLIAALICFGLAAAGVTSRVNLIALGLFLVTLTTVLRVSVL